MMPPSFLLGHESWVNIPLVCKGQLLLALNTKRNEGTMNMDEGWEKKRTRQRNADNILRNFLHKAPINNKGPPSLGNIPSTCIFASPIFLPFPLFLREAIKKSPLLFRIHYREKRRSLKTQKKKQRRRQQPSPNNRKKRDREKRGEKEGSAPSSAMNN